MKKVLAELHELINELEDNGLTAEASSLQEVFVRVAQEADTKDDLKNDVENILKSHSAPEVIAELAKQMASESEPKSDTQTMSFAFGDKPGPEPAPYKEPAHVIMNEFIGQAIKGDMDPDHAYFRMNQRLESNQRGTISKPQFDTYVKNKSVINPNLTVRQDKVPVPEQTPEHREKVLKDFSEKMDEMNKYYDKNIPWTTAPMPYSSLSSENFYEKKR